MGSTNSKDKELREGTYTIQCETSAFDKLCGLRIKKAMLKTYKHVLLAQQGSHSAKGS